MNRQFIFLVLVFLLAADYSFHNQVQGVSKLCRHPRVVGHCGGGFKRFYFDIAAKDCKQFKYSGCGGNNNNFATMQECVRKCALK